MLQYSHWVDLMLIYGTWKVSILISLRFKSQLSANLYLIAENMNINEKASRCGKIINVKEVKSQALYYS